MEKKNIIFYSLIILTFFILIGFLIISNKTFTSNATLSLEDKNIYRNLEDSLELGIIQIKNIEYEKEVLKIIYNFDSSEFIGNLIGIDIWLKDSSNIEIIRTRDEFPINKDGLIEREVIINLPDDLIGNYHIFLSLSSDTSNFVKESIFFEETSISGKNILDISNFESESKFLFCFFILILIVGVFLIIKNKKIENKSKNKELLKKDFKE